MVGVDGPDGRRQVAIEAHQLGSEAVTVAVRQRLVEEVVGSDDRLIALLCYISQILIPVVMPVIVLLSESSKRRSFQRLESGA